MGDFTINDRTNGLIVPHQGTKDDDLLISPILEA